MATNGSTTAERVREYAPPQHHAPEFETPEEERNDPLGGDPAMIGLPAFIVGAIALGLTLVGFVSAESAGAPLAIILAATGVGQMMAAVWAARLGQSAEASVFMIFGGFWISYAVLILGLGHNWFGVTESDVVHTEGIFLIAWLATVVMLTLATLRLPAVFTLLFVLVDVSLAFSLISTLGEMPGLQHAAGAAVFGFTAVGVYLYFSAASAATGGRELPMGRPIIGS